MANVKESLFKEMVNQVISNKILRNIAVKQLNKFLYNSITDVSIKQLEQDKMDQFYFSSSVVDQAKNNLDRGFIKPAVLKKMVKVFVGDNYSPEKHTKINPLKTAYKEKYGEYPPLFLVLSPGKRCNLNCIGCYASANTTDAEILDYETVRRIVREAHDILGNRFMTISGGEPLLYHSEGKNLFDLFKEFDDMFFLMYTNGTLVNKETAKKLADLGNVTPAISLEGWEEHTDQRRGKGVFKSILKAMENLRSAGVPFGISLTATKQNTETLLRDDYYEFFFNEMGASYMWQFQLMPIGRAKDTKELMVSPGQRISLFKEWHHLLKDKHFPIADFWNSSSLSSGCLAYGRWAGYFYIDWKGNVMPCVFIPYYVDNIKDLYRDDKTIADALQSRFFKNGREWQKEYGFENLDHKKNSLMPCSIRDHYLNFKNNIITPEVKSEDEETRELLQDKEFEKVMDDFDTKLQTISEEIYYKEYLKKDLVENI
jgi:MoaA/NifB/PqqE/SkfB family radical SAM enzyme